MSDGIKEKIEELGRLTPGIGGVMYGRKRVGGVLTDTPAIVFSVREKKPLSDLPPGEVLPSSVVAGGEVYVTDVVEESSEVRALACYAFDDPEILRLQGNPSFLTPVKGGQEIIEFPTGWSPAGSSWNISVGTLGLVCVDNEDGRPVGLTNAHVACGVFFKNSKRSLDLETENPYNLYEERLFVPTGSMHPPGAVVNSGGSVNISSPIAPTIKRYLPLDKTPEAENNYVDACILSMNDSFLGDESHAIHQPSGTVALNGGSNFVFATTAEIDGLLSSGGGLYSTGRTTGPKGWGLCRLVVDAIFVSVNVTYEYAGSNFNVPFADVIRFRYDDGGTFPVAGGDSGSALLAEIGGQVKVVGLVFAGNGGSQSSPSPGTHYGYACRIDRVASEMNLRAWDSSYARISSQGSAQVLIMPYDGTDEKTLVSGGIKYYNVGLAKES